MRSEPPRSVAQKGATLAGWRAVHSVSEFMEANLYRCMMHQYRHRLIEVSHALYGIIYNICIVLVLVVIDSTGVLL